MIGTKIGPLVITQLLGEGGMGRVYLAEHAVLRSKRAVKILRSELTKNAMIVTRFVNEARAAASLHHRSLLQVHDVGQLPDGSWFIVLDYLDGGTLKRYLASQGGAIAPHLIVELVAGIANGLHVAHAAGIIHRDLKPDNIFLISREGNPHHPVIIDWGVAQLSEELSPGTGTRTGLVIGTPAYMAPEQLRGGKVGPGADVYSLATIVYAMATGGCFPYQLEGETRADYFRVAPTELYHRQMSSSPIDPRRRFPKLGDAFAAVVLAGLKTDVTARTRSAQAYALALAEATPTDGIEPDGLAILRTVARELVDTNAMLDTIRSSLSQATPAPPPTSRYQLGRKLGTGGMAEVYVATARGEHGFERQIAVKRILPGLSDVPAFASMFVGEAQIAARLSHPNIVSVVDFSRDAEGRLCLVMELVEGKDLAALVESGPLPPSIAVYITVELLRALGYAHALSGARGLIHRDISPHNLMVSYEGAVKVLDFGLAKLKEVSGAVRSETVRGKPSYMSPEQINGEELDHRSDLFAVGVMLWEMLAHRKLFEGSAMEIAGQLWFRDIPAASSVRSRVPADVEAVALRLLARDREQRYPTAEAVIEELLRCDDAPRDGRGELVRLLRERFPESSAFDRAAGSSSPIRRLHAAQIAVAEPQSTLAGAASQSVPARGIARRRLIIAALVALVVVGCAIGLVLGTRLNASPQLDAGVLVMATNPGEDAPQQLDVGVLAMATNPDEDAPQLDAGGLAMATDAIVDASGVLADASVATPEPRTPIRVTEAPVAVTDAGVPDAAASGPSVASRPRAVEYGVLVVRVTPWADVIVDGKLVGTTPLDTKLPVGRHRVVLANETQKKVVTVMVTTSKPATIEETW